MSQSLLLSPFGSEKQVSFVAEITRKQLKTNGRKQTDTYQYNVSEYVYMDKKVWIRKNRRRKC